MAASLEIAGLTVRFGSVVALDDVDLSVPEGTAVAVVGPLGAGKSTLLQAVAGLVDTTRGTITLDGEAIDRSSVPDRARRGVCYVPASRGVFPGLTVAENLALMLPDAGDADAVYDTFPALASRQGLRAGNLSGGEQRLLALARALSSRTRLVMVDEPFHGLAPRAVTATTEVLARLSVELGRTVLVADDVVARVEPWAGVVVRMRAGRVEAAAVAP